MNWQLVLPRLYTKSNSKAEPWTQSQVWGEHREHNVSMAILVQHLALHAHTLSLLSLTRTHALPESISFLASYLELSPWL